MNGGQQQMNIDLTKTEEIICSECQGKTFEEVILLRRVSRFIVQTTQDALIPITVMACKNCKTILQETMPVQLRDKKEEPKKASNIQIAE